MKKNFQFSIFNFRMDTRNGRGGFSMTEVVVAVAISVVIVIAVTSFARGIIRLNASAQSTMTALLETRKVLSVMVSELRSAIPSALGSYPIESATASSIVFFADVNNDEVADRIRYFYDPATRSVRRGVVMAAGSPPGYDMGSETFSILISGVETDASFPLFEYFDGDHAGTSSPLPVPVNIQNVRHIKVNARVNRNPNLAVPELMNMSSRATLRNLKDNI